MYLKETLVEWKTVRLDIASCGEDEVNAFTIIGMGNVINHMEKESVAPRYVKLLAFGSLRVLITKLNSFR